MLDEEDLADEVGLARPDVRPRAAPAQPEDSGTKPSQLSDTDIDTLRSKFPHTGGALHRVHPGSVCHRAPLP
jgi:hypothetical protein